MAYQSVDQLQKVLAENVFHYAKDSKKAAGRALGTLVEIITFYALKSWGLEKHIAIERPLPEYANDTITHNVEFSLHPSKPLHQITFDPSEIPLKPSKILKKQEFASLKIDKNQIKSHALLDKNFILRNSCTLCDMGSVFLTACLNDLGEESGHFSVASLSRRPFAMFECKRVGVEEGMKKGPQTIEKAKQGAYVARTVSALQRIRFSDGSIGGMIQREDGTLEYGDYYELMAKIIASNDAELLSQFILTIGVVSNHGNWFTSEHHNKELKVLAQSYDWLLFLTDQGVAQFIEDFLLTPKDELMPAQEAFLASYHPSMSGTKFTKVKIALKADEALQVYFKDRMGEIDGWFNIIAPRGNGLNMLKEELFILSNKQWQEIHK